MNNNKDCRVGQLTRGQVKMKVSRRSRWSMWFGKLLENDIWDWRSSLTSSLLMLLQQNAIRQKNILEIILKLKACSIGPKFKKFSKYYTLWVFRFLCLTQLSQRRRRRRRRRIWVEEVSYTTETLSTQARSSTCVSSLANSLIWWKFVCLDKPRGNMELRRGWGEA